MPIRTYLYVWFCSIFSTSIYKCLKAHIRTHTFDTFQHRNVSFQMHISNETQNLYERQVIYIYVLYACSPRYLKLTRHLMHFKHRHDFHISNWNPSVFDFDATHQRQSVFKCDHALLLTAIIVYVLHHVINWNATDNVIHYAITVERVNVEHMCVVLCCGYLIIWTRIKLSKEWNIIKYCLIARKCCAIYFFGWWIAWNVDSFKQRVLFEMNEKLLFQSHTRLISTDYST